MPLSFYIELSRLRTTVYSKLNRSRLVTSQTDNSDDINEPWTKEQLC